MTIIRGTPKVFFRILAICLFAGFFVPSLAQVVYCNGVRYWGACPSPSGPSPAELARQRNEQEAKEARARAILEEARMHDANDYGVALYEKERYEDALIAFDEALGHSPNDSVILGNIQKTQQKVRAAAATREEQARARAQVEAKAAADIAAAQANARRAASPSTAPATARNKAFDQVQAVAAKGASDTRGCYDVGRGCNSPSTPSGTGVFASSVSASRPLTPSQKRALEGDRTYVAERTAFARAERDATAAEKRIDALKTRQIAEDANARQVDQIEISKQTQALHAAKGVAQIARNNMEVARKRVLAGSPDIVPAAK